MRILTRDDKLRLYEWLSATAYTMGYSRTTYHKAVNLFERLANLTRDNCRLYIATCLMLAAKLEEHSVHVTSFVEICKDVHSHAELLAC